ncbi:hypothetical protein AAG570_012886 [Ranatra chinensis]|uniref:Uncharacterized protein n=1 Tax=Ranatra chinensis TaxID=642074 RepID=A0ABD0YRK4_9HEMI
MACVLWLISTTFSHPERRYTTENIIQRTHNISTTIQNAIGIKKGSQKENEKRIISSEDDDKKTLAQQVADGKYGLIQKEIFSKRAKRPGILSYEINPEVPKDNINNLGGLEPEEIWLAENHLLVLKGGLSSKNHVKNNNDIWRPIDNYVAPKRQVKIPPNPRVPPPFPVQLSDKGPIQLIQAKNKSNTPYPALFPTQNNGIKNVSELDEDDPRIYYPPPYDFVYAKDNFTTHVPPGPIVPGIILPPPPDFFAPLDLKHNRTNQEIKPASRGRKPEHVRTIAALPKNITAFTENRTNFKIKSMFRGENNTSSVKNDRQSNNKTKLLSTTHDQNDGWIPIHGNIPVRNDRIKPHRPPGSTDGIKENLNYVTEHIPLLQNTSTPYLLNTGINNYFRVSDNDANRNSHYTEMHKEQYYSTTPNPFEGIRHIILNLPNAVRTISSAYPYTFPLPKNNKEQYIFYRDPYILQDSPAIETFQDNRKPAQAFLQTEPKGTYETNTFPPTKLYDDTNVNVPPDYVKGIPKLSYYEEQYKKVSPQPGPPLQYIYYDQNRQKEPGYSYELPIQIQHTSFRSPEIQIYNVQGTRQSKTNQQHIRPTMKTPIYEYSFSAPGYGTAEAPKIATTLKPGTFQNAFTSYKRPQYAFYEYQTSPKIINNNRYDQSTSSPNFYRTLRPNFQRNNGYSNLHSTFQTENPFNAYFSHDVRVMDAITKKYFPTFGQKLNNININNPITTPLPQSAERTPERPYNENIRDSHYNEGNNNKNNEQVQSDKPYNQKSNAFNLQDYQLSEPNPRPNTQPIKYPQIYSSLPQYEDYNYDSEIVRPNHPLDSDIRVNFKNPLHINPEAEFIDPQNPSLQGQAGDNSYISYQLPGSGGHFYFLTPRSVKAENYHLANTGIKYPNHDTASRGKNAEQETPTTRRKKPEQNT